MTETKRKHKGTSNMTCPSSLEIFRWLFRNGMNLGNSLAVHWLGLRALTAKGPGSNPGQGTEIPQAKPSDQKEMG